MSRTPANYSMKVVRGATWEDEFTYTDTDGVAIDLTGYSARMQVRQPAGAYGLTTSTTLVMELTTVDGRLSLPTPTNGQLLLKVSAADTLLLNPDNLKKVKLVYSLELYVPVGVDPEYVIPLVKGGISVQGETTR